MSTPTETTDQNFVEHVPQKRSRRSKAEIAQIKAAIYEILEDRHPQTTRQLFYQLEHRGIVPKTEKAYTGTVSRLSGVMRENGELPWEWVTDSSRWMRKPASYSSMEAAVRETAQYYRRDLWANQNAYVEIWCEKDALSGVLYEITSEFDVPLMVVKGFSSKDFVHGAAEAIVACGKPAFLYYIGDWDPSGLKICNAVEASLRRYAPDADITFERLALTQVQIDVFGLPTRPTKREGNAHAKGFVGDSVEVDALPVNVLQQYVREAIEQHIDPLKLERTRTIEASEREVLKAWKPEVGA